MKSMQLLICMPIKMINEKKALTLQQYSTKFKFVKELESLKENRSLLIFKNGPNREDYHAAALMCDYQHKKR